MSNDDRHLVEAEARYRAIFEHARDALLLAGDEGRYVDANPAACALLGYAREELLTLSVFDVTPAEVREQGREFWRRFLAEGRMTGEYRLLRSDGSTVPVEFSATANVRPGLHLSITRDITDRHAQAHRLEAAEERFRWMVENISDIITILDSAGTILYQSPSIERVLGWRPEELIGRNGLELVHPEDLPAVAAAYDVRREDLVFSRYRFRHKDGSWRPLESTGRARDGRDGARMVIAASRDLSEREHLEAQLRQAQKLESIGLLAGGIAHDFNNMLTVIAGHAEMVHEDLPVDDPRRDDVAEIMRSAQKAAQLTYQLLAFSRQQILRPEPLHLNDVITDMSRMLRRVIGEDIVVSLDLAGDLGQVHADPGQLAQVIMNLALNARDAMPRGGELRIATGNVALDGPPAGAQAEDVAPGTYVMLAVADSGTGMTPDVLARIWEPFFTTKGVGRGTGMGLPTVYGIVRQSGGHIAVESVAGRGSTFKVYLPRVDVAASAVEPHRNVRPSRGHETLLLVEDEEAVRHLAKRALEAQGYTVIEATDGIEALAAHERVGGRVELLLTDVVMPVMNGRELAEALTAQDPDLRVLYMSGHTDDALVLRGVRDAGVDFIQKPFAMRELAQKVREVLDR